MFSKAFNILQNVGRSLMIPIALLPAAGLLLAFGTSFQDPNLVEQLPFLGNEYVVSVLQLLSDAGNIIFANLPLIFAVGVAIGLSKGDGVAALAAITGYLIMSVTIGNLLGITSEQVESSSEYAEIMGIPTLQTGVFGGIIVGLIASFLYNRYYNIQLPSWLQFFAGKRFVPIITSFAALFLGGIMSVVWPYAQDGLNAMSYFVTNQNLAISSFLFGFIERLAIPFGLNHIWWPIFWLEFGSYENEAGEIIRGDQLIFFSQLRDNVNITAGAFMSGMGIVKMFGLPAAALAIYHTAKPEKKQYVKGIMLAGAITSIVAGVTEPLEFSFVFVAPVLYLMHAILTGMGFALMTMLDVHVGLSFSGGLIDFILFGVLPGAERTNWITVIPVGLAMACIYYFLFRFAITKFNIMTPGREDIDNNTNNEKISTEPDQLANDVLVAFGGKENITELNACMSRLRITVNNKEFVDENRLKSLGAAGITGVGKHIQAIFGTKSDQLKENIRLIMDGKDVSEFADSKIEEEEESQFSLIALKDFKAPLTGKVLPLSKVPDKTFSEKMMGDGFAIDMENEDVTSPVNGEVMMIFPTKHAIAIRSDEGNEILIHVGLDTVDMEGDGFEAFVTEGDKVETGQPLIQVDINKVKERGLPLITPIIFTNFPKEEYEIQLTEKTYALKGEGPIVMFGENTPTNNSDTN